MASPGAYRPGCGSGPGGGTGRAVRGVLERVVEGGEVTGCDPQGGGDQPVGQPGVLRQQGAVEVRAEDVAAAHALEAVAPVVAVTGEHAAQRGGVRGEVGPAGVVLEPREHPRAVEPGELGLDGDVADQPGAV